MSGANLGKFSNDYLRQTSDPLRSRTFDPSGCRQLNSEQLNGRQIIARLQDEDSVKLTDLMRARRPERSASAAETSTMRTAHPRTSLVSPVPWNGVVPIPTLAPAGHAMKRPA